MIDLIQQTSPYQSVGIFFVVFLMLHFVMSFILKKTIHYAQNTQNKLDDYLVNALNKPIKTLLWFAWFYLSAHTLKGEFLALKNLLEYLDITPLFILTWAGVRVISAFESHALERKTKVENDTIRLLMRLIKISIIALAILVVLQNQGFTVSSILAFGGMGGVIIGFAAKDMLANIFGGLMIQMDKPFSTGDWIRSKDFEGVVEKIGWRMTRIRTFSKNPIYIPNSIFSSLPIETPSRMTNRRIKEIIGIRYDDITQLPNILQEIEQMLKNSQGINQKQPLRVYFNHFNASSLDFHIYAFTNTVSKDKYQQVKQQILLDIAKIIDKNKAEIAYPTQTLHLQK